MTHTPDVALGDCRSFVAAAFFGSIGYHHFYSVPGYETPEDVRAFHAGEATLFDQLAGWFDDDVFDGAVVARRDDRHGLFWLAIESDLDAVQFKLAWNDRLSPSVWKRSVIR